MTTDKVTIRDVYDIVGRVDDKLSKKIDDYMNKIDETHKLFYKKHEQHENDIVETKTKLSAFQVFQSSLTLIVGAIAAWLGARQ